MPVEDKRERALKVTAESKESKDLARLLELINTPASKQQLPSIKWVPDENQNQTVTPWVGSTSSTTVAHHHQSTEAVTLEQFSSRYYGIRIFSSHPQQAYFGQIFTALVKQRVCCQEWIQRAPPENILRALICLRMLMRDPAYQTEFFSLGGVKILSERLQLLTESYLENGEEQFTVDILKEMTNICQKLSADVKQREWLVACGTHKALVLLLSASDVIVLHCSLYALISLAQSERPRAMIGELNCIETLLRILQDYDILSKTLAASLLRTLCADGGMREQVKVFDGIPICLSLLHCENLKLLWNVVWIIVQMAEDTDSSNDIRLLGGIPLLLALLQDRKFSSSENGQELNSGDQARSSTAQEPESEPMEEILSLKAAACAALSELVLNDTNGQQIVQANGVYLLGVLILPHESSNPEEASAAENLQRNAFRALRFLFSMERNRQLFKRLFPPDLFEKFIDVGHYVRELSAYKVLVEKLNSLSEEDIAVIRSNIQATNQNKAPSHMIGAYAVHELLGSGAFGSVYKVQKRHGAQTFYAMKEISIHSQILGKTAKERGKSIGEIVNECTIMKEQMRHPNVVRYYKAFEEKDKLYVIMELVEGAPLGEHFNSLIEKKACFGEDRLWHIFIQLVLGLRYIHKEKHIIHRDLTPNNIMLGENDKVTITDFGLAKQRNPDASKMTSVVGTILYSCPEVVQSQPYGEKADVWAAGCILYQMATLKAPFYSTNMLALATKIVEAQYEPVPPGRYSDRVSAVVSSCLKPDPDERPDIVGVAAQMSDIMLIYMDRMKNHEINLEKKLDRERKRTQRHYIEANRNMHNYHRLFWASQERYDKLMTLSSSGGAAGLRNVPDGNDSVFEMSDDYSDYQRTSETESAPAHGDSGIVFNSADSGCVLDLNSNVSNSAEQNGSRNSSTTSPNLSFSKRHKKDLKPVITDKTNSAKAKNGDLTHSPNKTQTEKPSGVSRSNIETSPISSKVHGDKTHTFTVPKPPGLRKGARRHLTMDLPAVCKPNTGSTSAHTPSVSGATSAPIPAPSAVDIATCRRTQSSSAAETYRRQNSGQLKARPPTAAATLSISPRKVRQISDPILQILHQLHKIIFITQLPPTLSQNPQRRIIERFKRALFAPQSSSFNLKSELKKVIEGSRELIDLKFGFGDPSYLHQQDNTDKLVSSIGLETADGQEIGISYENMQTIIENVLMESGYYDMSPNVRNRSVPLGPIGTVPSASHR